MQNVFNKDFLLALGNRVRHLRENASLTQEELGFLVGNSGKQIGRIERGEHNVTTCMIFAIAKALNLHVKVFFDFEVEGFHPENISTN